MGAQFIFDDSYLSAINHFTDDADKLRAYEAIANYAINGAEPVVDAVETTEVKSTSANEITEGAGEQEGQAEEKIVNTTIYTATFNNAFMPFFEGVKERIDAGIKKLEDMDALTAKYNEYIEKVDAFMKQQEEKKAEEQTDTFGKPDTVNLAR